MTPLDAALALIARGWNPVPVSNASSIAPTSNNSSMAPT
jgi:hypothetical protein